MIKTLQKYWHIFWLFRRMQFMRMIEYRANFVFWCFISIMWTIFNIFFFTLLLGVTDSIGGWTQYEIYILLGVFTIVDAFTWSLFYFNMARYTGSIYNGELNSVLVKPVNPIFLLMTQYNNYNNIFRFFIGVFIVIWASGKLNLEPSFLQILIFICVLIVALLFIYFLWFILSTLAFYFEKLDNINEVIPNIRKIWQVPRDVYPGFFALIINYIVPLGLITSLPSELLLGKGSLPLALFFLAITLLVIYSAHRFFYFSIKHYIGTAN